MIIIWAARCLQRNCTWGVESESKETVCASAKEHEAANPGHETVLNSRFQRSKKKPFRKPELIEYGNVAQLTAGPTGTDDRGHGLIKRGGEGT